MIELDTLAAHIPVFLEKDILGRVKLFADTVFNLHLRILTVKQGTFSTGLYLSQGLRTVMYKPRYTVRQDTFYAYATGRDPCQRMKPVPNRFRALLDTEEARFNERTMMYIMYVDAILILYIVDEATRFCAARFLPT